MELERIVEQMRQEGQQIPYPETTTLAHPTNLQMPNFPKKPKTVQQAKVPDDVPAEAKEVLVRLLCRAGSAGRAGSGGGRGVREGYVNPVAVAELAIAKGLAA